MTTEPTETQLWTATNQLRWVYKPSLDMTLSGRPKVLEQLWQGDIGSQEWRDVPTVEQP